MQPRKHRRFQMRSALACDRLSGQVCSSNVGAHRWFPSNGYVRRQFSESSGRRPRRLSHRDSPTSPRPLAEKEAPPSGAAPTQQHEGRLETAESRQPAVEVLIDPTPAAARASARRHRDGSRYRGGEGAQGSERTTVPGSIAVRVSPRLARVNGRRMKIARIARHLGNGRGRSNESASGPGQ